MEKIARATKQQSMNDVRAKKQQAAPKKIGFFKRCWKRSKLASATSTATKNSMDQLMPMGSREHIIGRPKSNSDPDRDSETVIGCREEPVPLEKQRWSLGSRGSEDGGERFRSS